MANACGSSSWRQDVRAALSATVCGLILLVTACATSGPPPVQYVLGTDQAPPRAVNPVRGRQVVEVRPVRLPEYLDTRDLLVRKGNQLVPSMTGQWAERLSVGMTRALALALGPQLPNAALFTTEPVQRPARQLLLDVTSFEARADQEVILTARWTFTDGTGRNALLSQDTVLVEPTGSTSDEAVVNAMNKAVEALASQIAASIKRGVPMA
jgi:cholesterol transport system auxiliary component